MFLAWWLADGRTSERMQTFKNNFPMCQQSPNLLIRYLVEVYAAKDKLKKSSAHIQTFMQKVRKLYSRCFSNRSNRIWANDSKPRKWIQGHSGKHLVKAITDLTFGSIQFLCLNFLRLNYKFHLYQLQISESHCDGICNLCDSFTFLLFKRLPHYYFFFNPPLFFT